MLRLKLAGIFLLLFMGATIAHDWYPYDCCSQQDCAPLDQTNVRVGVNGYAVIIPPGSHPQWGSEKTEALLLTIPYKQAKPSPDGKFHICLNPSGQLLCFFQAVGAT